MSEEIVIKTETVKVDELQGREKQIYDYAYQKGKDDVSPKYPGWWEITKEITMALLFLAFVFFIIALTVSA